MKFSLMLYKILCSEKRCRFFTSHEILDRVSDNIGTLCDSQLIDKVGDPAFGVEAADLLNKKATRTHRFKSQVADEEITNYIAAN